MNILSTINELEQLLSSERNVARAPKAEAYMKHKFPFFGMETAVRRSIQKSWITGLKTCDDRNLRWELIRELWSRDEREFHYVAMDWLNSWPKKWISPLDASELKWLLVHHSWWDSVDTIASNYLGKWAKLYPAIARDTFEEWREETSFWLHRSCLIYQLKYGNHVDAVYLESLIAQFLPNKEFFIQKAIGWSLRQYSKFQPEQVKQILKNHPIQGLALREASKYLT
jgi:3-methyladenine DNA glycosylase AlkD